MKQTISTRSAEALLLGVTIVASAGWLFTKNALAEFQPYTFLALRFLLAGSVLLLFCHRELFKLEKKQVSSSISTGLVLAVSLLVWVLGIHQTASIGEGSFIVSLTVVLVPLLGRIFFGDKLEVSLLIALIPAVIGLALLVLKQGANFDVSQFYFIASTFGFAFHVILTSRYVKNMPALPMAGIQLMVVGVLASGAAVFYEEWSFQITFMGWTWLILSALIATSLRFAMQTNALRVVSPSHAGMIFILEPVWTAVLGALFLMERMSAQQLWGCVFIMAALFVYRANSFTKKLSRYANNKNRS